MRDEKHATHGEHRPAKKGSDWGVDPQSRRRSEAEGRELPRGARSKAKARRERGKSESEAKWKQERLSEEQGRRKAEQGGSGSEGHMRDNTKDKVN
ncbi:hypothetical protein NL676_038725 [Syzygium grande]|nr:hypothetical protein NL676_038725 [Syzygium grande]